MIKLFKHISITTPLMLSLMSGDLVASDDKLELVPASSSQVQGIVPLYAFSPDELVEFDKFKTGR